MGKRQTLSKAFKTEAVRRWCSQVSKPRPGSSLLGGAALFGALLMTSCGPPADRAMLAEFGRNERCFVQMASTLVSKPGELTIEYRFLEMSLRVTPPTRDVGEHEFWRDCMSATNASQISVISRAHLLSARTGTVTEPVAEDRTVWFQISGGFFAFGQEKGVVFVVDDQTGELGPVELSLDRFANAGGPPPPFDRPVFRKIKDNWYLYYQAHR